MRLFAFILFSQIFQIGYSQDFGFEAPKRKTYNFPIETFEKTVEDLSKRHNENLKIFNELYKRFIKVQYQEGYVTVSEEHKFIQGLFTQMEEEGAFEYYTKDLSRLDILIYKLELGYNNEDKNKNPVQSYNCTYSESLPKDILTVLDKCNEWYMEGKYEECIEKYDMLLLEYPNFCLGYYKRGVVNYNFGDKENAKKDFNKAVSLGSASASQFLNTYYK